jgi:hypothetical protein
MSSLIVNLVLDIDVRWNSSVCLDWQRWTDLRTILPENGPLETDVRNEWG